MKSTLFLILLYLCLSLLIVSCTKSAPEPACVQAEVVGKDCDNGWYILRLIEDEKQGAGFKTGTYIGQLQEGFVTTDNLPDIYKKPGLRIGVALELNGEYSPRCTAVHMMYPAVRVKRVCAGEPS